MLKTPNEVELDYDEQKHRIIVNTDEQLPLTVVSSTDGCFVYDSYGALLGETYRQDWENDPKGYTVWMAEELRKAYETPVDMLKQAARHEDMLLFYDSEYPDDDVPCEQNFEERFFKTRDLPLLDDRECIDPQESPLTVTTQDNYTDGEPSWVRIHNGDTVVAEWEVDHSENESKNVDLGAEVAWNIRLAYERPWKLIDSG